MVFLEVPFASPLYQQTIDLRTQILRTPLGLEFYPEDLAKEWNSFHLACYDDQWHLLGCLVLKPVNDTHIKMRQVAVDDRIQKKGVGTALVKFSEKFAREKGYAVMELNARETAVPFYLKLDYQIEGDRFEEVNIPHFRMVKTLDHSGFPPSDDL